jgi:hypothetical protein
VEAVLWNKDAAVRDTEDEKIARREELDVIL